MKNTDNFHFEENPSHATAKSTLFVVSKAEGDTKEDTKFIRMHCTYCGMPKGTSRAEVTLNSEKNQACSLSRYRVTLV